MLATACSARLGLMLLDAFVACGGANPKGFRSVGIEAGLRS